MTTTTDSTTFTSTAKDWEVDTSGDDEVWTCDKEGFADLRILITQDPYPESPREWSNLWKLNLSVNRYGLPWEDELFGDAKKPNTTKLSEFVSIWQVYKSESPNRVKALRDLLTEYEDYAYHGFDEDGNEPDWYHESWGDDDVLAHVRDNYPVDDYLVVPVYAYIHGGIALSVGRGGQFSDPWDSGTAGFALLDINDACHWFMVDREDFDPAQAYKNLEGEIETYNQYLCGDVWGYIVERLNRYAKIIGDTVDVNETLDNWEAVESCSGYYGSDTALEEAVLMAKYIANDKED